MAVATTVDDMLFGPVASVGVFSASEEYSEAGGVNGAAATAADTYTNCGDGGAPSPMSEHRGVSGGVGAATVTILGGGSGGNDLNIKTNIFYLERKTNGDPSFQRSVASLEKTNKW